MLNYETNESIVGEVSIIYSDLHEGEEEEIEDAGNKSYCSPLRKHLIDRNMNQVKVIEEYSKVQISIQLYFYYFIPFNNLICFRSSRKILLFQFLILIRLFFLL